MSVDSITPDHCGDQGLRESYAAGAWFARVSIMSFAVVVVAVILLVRKRAVRGFVVASVVAIACALVAIFATYVNMRSIIEDCHDQPAAAASTPASGKATGSDAGPSE